MLSQVEIENRMAAQGMVRSKESMEKAEEGGQAERNPYAQQIFREFVEPLHILIDAALAEKGAARRQAHAVLLRPLDSWGVAYIAVRIALTAALAKPQNTRGLGYSIGKAVHTELYLTQFEHLSADLYFTLCEDLGRRKSKDIEHRLKVFKAQAKKAKVNIVEWDNFSRHQVGLFLLDKLVSLGMLTVGEQQVLAGKRPPVEVGLHPDVLETISHIKGFFAMTQPVFAPCVEKPIDWTAWDNGGFHTPKMRRALPYCVKAPNTCRALLREHTMPKVLKAINALQNTAWQVNGRMLDVMLEIAKDDDCGEIMTTRELAKPVRPEWFDEKRTAEMNTQEAAEFIAWKRETAAWHTARKLAAAKRGRFYTATRAAQEYREYPAIYFVHFADSRGRLYPLTYGVSPQGSDMQKALLQFAVGKPLHTPDAVDWFLINGANRWGFDKAKLRDRAVWHRDKVELLLSFANDPINNRGWEEADKPLQFLAWCMEYAAWRADPHDFVSHQPVGMDGSCNGLQNFSAMLRDEVGGKATNLTNNEVMQDIYKQVADKATERMAACQEPDPFNHKAKWLAHGVNRTVVKRAVMTTPYGVTQRSAVKYVIEDYLKAGKAKEFTSKDHYQTANVLMSFAWPAIGDVVVKAREAMDWLRNGARSIIKENLDEEGKTKDEGTISWVTPSGFLASQAYYLAAEHRINTKMYGHQRILVLTEQDEASVDRHATALAPNFVHSMDASHLHLTTCALVDKVDGISLAMIHDDYGTHAADAQVMYDTIRQEFVSMYELHDPLLSFSELYPMCGSIPSRGSLDLREVLESDYFFS